MVDNRSVVMKEAGLITNTSHYGNERRWFVVTPTIHERGDVLGCFMSVVFMDDLTVYCDTIVV